MWIFILYERSCFFPLALKCKIDIQDYRLHICDKLSVNKLIDNLHVIFEFSTNVTEFDHFVQPVYKLF